VRFIFQPAEEHGRGAAAMLADGLLERFPVDEIYGVHNIPGLPAGHIATRAGGIMASEDNFVIRITRPRRPRGAAAPGRRPAGGRRRDRAGAADHRGALGRPADPAVVSCTEIHTDGIRNAIPSEVVIRGDTRSYSPAVQALLSAPHARAVPWHLQRAWRQLHGRVHARIRADGELAAVRAGGAAGGAGRGRRCRRRRRRAAHDDLRGLRRLPAARARAPSSSSATALAATRAACRCTTRATTSTTASCRSARAGLPSWPACGCRAHPHRPDMHFQNPRATRAPYPDELRAVLSHAACTASRARLAAWPQLPAPPTPAWSLPGLAAALGVATITVKDESRRSELASFKALGAPNALVALVQRRWADRGWSAAELFAGRHAEALSGFVVISATDGNHGRALAAAAQSLGCRCVIVLHALVSEERESAIAAYGAEIVRIAGDYDASVREAARLAREHGWEVVSDTSYEGYEDVPRDVMQGYAVIADELLETAPEGAPCPWTHVFLQGGVGGLAAGIVSHFWQRYGALRPRFVVVEPEQADCLLQSAVQGRATRASGSVDSVMAGLACGETSPLAWRFLQPAVDLFMTVPDTQAEAAMRTLADGAGGDIPIVAGESAVAGLAALQRLRADAEGRAAAGLDANSRVLLISTEGATAPAVYAGIVGRPHTQVLAAQQAWLAANGIAQDGLMQRLDELAQVGAIDGGGVCRIALTDADRLGRDQLVRWMNDLGLQVRIDAIGNLFGLRTGTTDLPPVMTGSHIDSVATGGRYDGSYGVLAGLEVVRWLERAKDRDAAAAGRGRVHQRRRCALPARHDGLAGACRRPAAGAGAGHRRHRRPPPGRRAAAHRLRRRLACGTIVPHAYVELHIEQGPVMEAEGVQIGAVQDLQGISWQEFTVTGQSNHAGTTPMRLRRDAGHGAAAISVFVRELTHAPRRPGRHRRRDRAASQPDQRDRGARHRDRRPAPHRRGRAAARRTRAGGFRRHAGRRAAAADRDPPAGALRAGALRRAAGAHDRSRGAGVRGHATRRMTSGAGHDAQMLARTCPAAMIFVPSVGGISHNPREHTDAEDLAARCHRAAGCAAGAGGRGLTSGAVRHGGPGRTAAACRPARCPKPHQNV
jgi:N-carbamoyl-L-amino-acid hydrolase